MVRCASASRLERSEVFAEFMSTHVMPRSSPTNVRSNWTESGTAGRMLMAQQAPETPPEGLHNTVRLAGPRKLSKLPGRSPQKPEILSKLSASRPDLSDPPEPVAGAATVDRIPPDRPRNCP